MDLKEAKIIASIVATADGGCETCVEELVDKLNKTNLGFVWWMEPDGVSTTGVDVKVDVRQGDTSGDGKP